MLNMTFSVIFKHRTLVKLFTKKVLNEDQTCEFINYCLAKCETCLVWTLAGFNAYVDKTTQQLEVIHDLAAKMAGKLDEY